jgi:hypothetical protein
MSYSSNVRWKSHLFSYDSCIIISILFLSFENFMFCISSTSYPSKAEYTYWKMFALPVIEIFSLLSLCGITLIIVVVIDHQVSSWRDFMKTGKKVRLNTDICWA